MCHDISCTILILLPNFFRTSSELLVVSSRLGFRFAFGWAETVQASQRRCENCENLQPVSNVFERETKLKSVESSKQNC